MTYDMKTYSGLHSLCQGRLVDRCSSHRLPQTSLFLNEIDFYPRIQALLVFLHKDNQQVLQVKLGTGVWKEANKCKHGKSVQNIYKITFNVNLKVLKCFDISEKQNHTSKTFNML